MCIIWKCLRPSLDFSGKFCTWRAYVNSPLNDFHRAGHTVYYNCLAWLLCLVTEKVVCDTSCKLLSCNDKNVENRSGLRRASSKIMQLYSLKCLFGTVNRLNIAKQSLLLNGGLGLGRRARRTHLYDHIFLCSYHLFVCMLRYALLFWTRI